MCSFSNDPISLWCMEMTKTENGPFILFGLLVLIVLSIGGTAFLLITGLPFRAPRKRKLIEGIDIPYTSGIVFLREKPARKQVATWQHGDLNQNMFGTFIKFKVGEYRTGLYTTAQWLAMPEAQRIAEERLVRSDDGNVGDDEIGRFAKKQWGRYSDSGRERDIAEGSLAPWD